MRIGTAELESSEAASRRLRETPPRRRLSAKAAARKLVLSAFGAKERLAAEAGLLLTFDDGPDPDVTPAVLDLLARYDAKAVFFIVGNRIPRAPQMLSRILKEGHWIGNHTFRHPLGGTPSFIEYYRDVKNCQAVIESHIGQRPSLFRPPLGSLTFASLLAPRLAGLQTMLWSVDVDDWKLRRDDDAVRAGNRLAELAAPGDIVLLHDDNSCVVPLLETALPKLCDRQLDVTNALSRVVQLKRCYE